MTKFVSLLVAASLALTASAAASAQDGTATLRVDRGNVMTSQGGDFAPAQSGQALASGERLMVSEGSAATVTYGNDCSRSYTTPGVYTVEKDCKKSAVADDDMTNWTMVGAIGLGAAVLAASVSGDDEDAPPVSR